MHLLVHRLVDPQLLQTLALERDGNAPLQGRKKGPISSNELK
jgi:hypothetical protein